MKQLSIAATIGMMTILMIFAGTCWVTGGSPLEPPAKAIEAASMARQADAFGGMFDVRGPIPGDRADRHVTGRIGLELTPRPASWP